MWFPKALIIGLALIGPAFPQAGTGSAADYVLISETDSIPDDVYAAGNVVDVRGVVEGDLTAAASQRIVVSGTIEGDVIAIAPYVEITGDVTGTIRVVADRISIVGSVGEDVVLAGRQATIAGVVGRDAMLFVHAARLTGSVTDKFQAQSTGVVSIAGGVQGDLEVNARLLDISSVARVGGDVRYRGDAEISEDADLASDALQLGKTPIPLRVRALVLVGQVLAGLFVLLAGLAVFWLAPRATEAAASATRNWLWAAIVGSAALVIPAAFVGGVITAMGAASPDLFGVALLATSPVVLLYLSMLAFMVVLGFVPMASSVGRVITRGRMSTVGAFMIGVFVLAAMASVPVIGPRLLPFLWLVGVGGWFLGARAIRGRSVTGPSD